MEYGIVKWFNDQRGFGFIRRKNGQDAFVHYADINGDKKSLAEGDEVMFDIEEGNIRTVVKNVMEI
jgi:CspA family cold shock protein